MRNPAILVICLLLVCLAAAETQTAADKKIPNVTSVDLYGEEYHYTSSNNVYVSFTGIVTDQFHDESNPDYCFMTIADDYGTAYLSIMREHKNFIATNDYVGCRVSIVGRNTDTFSKPKGTRQYLHRELQLSEWGSFTVLENPKADPFNVPELSPNIDVAANRTEAVAIALRKHLL